jgi:hypothetical protein
VRRNGFLRRRARPSWWALAVFGAACADAGGISPDAIRSAEKAALLAALDCAAGSDPVFAPVGAFVFPYIDRATALVSPGGDTTRVVGLELDLDALVDSNPVHVSLVGVLAWTRYDSLAGTIDSTVLLLGSSGPFPIADALAQSFSPANPGQGSGVMIHSPTPDTCELWAPRSGLLRIVSSGYGEGTTQGSGGLSMTLYRGTMAGDYTVTAKLVPDSATTVSTGQTYSGGVQSLKMRVSGLTLP